MFYTHNNHIGENSVVAFICKKLFHDYKKDLGKTWKEKKVNQIQ